MISFDIKLIILFAAEARELVLLFSTVMETRDLTHDSTGLEDFCAFILPQENE